MEIYKKYLNEETAEDYFFKKYPKGSLSIVVLLKNGKYDTYEYKQGELESGDTENKWDDIGIGDEEEWEDTKEPKLTKLFKNSKMVWVIDQ